MMLPSQAKAHPAPKPKPKSSSGVRRTLAAPKRVAVAPKTLPAPPPRHVPGPLQLTREPVDTDPPPVICPPPPEVKMDVDDEDMYVPPVPTPNPEPCPKRRPRRPRQDFHAALDGAEIKYDIWTNKQGVAHPNWIIACPFHHPCIKSRKDIPAHRAVHGELECLAYLHAWLPIPIDTTKANATHRQEDPSPAQVAAYFEAHRDELQALRDRLPY